MEKVGLNKSFWSGKNVLITGHTGFKGSWLVHTLDLLGANIFGYSLKPPTEINMYTESHAYKKMSREELSDIRDKENLKNFIDACSPEIVIHLAAQSLVSKGYTETLQTFDTNIMGTVNLFEACKNNKCINVILNITSDKCYENMEWDYVYRENDRIGGIDPYSCSKSCSELISKTYSNVLLNEMKIATARAGNVIGGGDWAENRLIPDMIRSIHNNDILLIRNPSSVRPWQHVIEPIIGYLILAEKNFNCCDYNHSWNFGPEASSFKEVKWILEHTKKCMPDLKWDIKRNDAQYESNLLMLDSTKSNMKLNWFSKWEIEQTIDKTIEWYGKWIKKENIEKFTCEQIIEYLNE